MTELRRASSAVVIPCFRVKAHILDVIRRVPSEVQKIYVVDDCCPEKCGEFVQSTSMDARVEVIFHEKNLGVGGAMVSGYQRALQDGYEIVAKIDGDGQMDPALLPSFFAPIVSGKADYTKGNRFYRMESLQGMPWVRLIGNAFLSFVSKLVTGYWDMMDPNNGYTAIHRTALDLIPLEKIEKRYFFETDLLFRLGTTRAVVIDVPMNAIYADEKSSLRIGNILTTFPQRYLTRIFKRVAYNYFGRDFNVGSTQLLGGLGLFVFGTAFGLFHWVDSATQGRTTPLGTIMIAAVSVILGFQLLLAFIQYDVASTPKVPLQNFTNALNPKAKA